MIKLCPFLEESECMGEGCINFTWKSCGPLDENKKCTQQYGVCDYFGRKTGHERKAHKTD